MSTFKRLYHGYGYLLRLCGLIASLTTFAMMLLVVANIGGRYFLNQPVTGTLEITESMLVAIIFLSLALTQYDGGHIRVTLMTRRLPAKVAHAANILCMSAGAVFFAWCTFAAWQFAYQSWSFNEYEWGTVAFPLYPVKFIVFLGLLMLTIQFALDTVAEFVMPIKADDETAMETF